MVSFSTSSSKSHISSVMFSQVYQLLQVFLIYFLLFYHVEYFIIIITKFFSYIACLPVCNPHRIRFGQLVGEYLAKIC